MLYALIETAKANKLEPRANLKYLFETLHHTRQPKDIEALLPHRLTPEMLKVPTPTLQGDVLGSAGRLRDTYRPRF